jgi:phosphate uptake regulator
LCHDGDGAVGATDLLSANDEVILVDLTVSVEQLADQVHKLLESPVRLLRVAQRASNKARSWSEEANAAKLVTLVEKALERAESHY